MPVVWLVFTAIDFTATAVVTLVALLLVPLATLVPLPGVRVSAVWVPVEPGGAAGESNRMKTGGVM